MSLRDKIIENSKKVSLVNEIEVVYDLVFIININSKGWILEKICKIIENASGLHCGYLFTERNDKLTSPLPIARAYWFAHYALAFSTMANYPEVWAAKRYVWFTHPDVKKGIDFSDLAICLSNCTHVFNPNSDHRKLLELIGVPGDKITVPLGGADHNVFLPHERGNGLVGFVSAYYPRKMPDKMLELIQAMPHRQFILIAPEPDSVVNKGILWDNYERYQELIALPNFEIVEVAYEKYPDFYAKMDVYVSLSALEGGPIPVIEAMMSNVVPVVSRTGFADDVIEQGKTGYVFDVSAPVEEIASLINLAFLNKNNLREQALNYSWENFGKTISSIINPQYKLGQALKLIQDGNANWFLRDGWHQAEKNGTWTGMQVAELELPVDISGEIEACSFSIFCKTFGTSKRNPPILDIYVNKTKIITHSFINDDPVNLSGFFPASLIAEDRYARVQLEFSETKTPHELAVNEDRRDLGVKVSTIKIDQVSPIMPCQTINFHQNLAVNSFLKAGWYKKDTSEWAFSDFGELNLPFSTNDRILYYRLKVKGKIQGLQNIQNASLKVEVNDIYAQEWNFSSDEVTEHYIDFPIFQALEILQVRFKKVITHDSNIDRPANWEFILLELSIEIPIQEQNEAKQEIYQLEELAVFSGKWDL